MNRPFWVSVGVAAVGVALILATIALSAPATVTARFSETGLPSGRAWSVTLANHTYTSSSDAVTISLLPAAYAFRVTLANGTDYVPFPASGHVDVPPTGTTLSVVFVRSQANVTLTEAGLPAGVWWTVAEGMTYHRSNTTSINISETDGDHTLRVLVSLTGSNPFWNHTTYVAATYYAANVSRVDLRVNGTDVPVQLQFSTLIQENSTLFPVNVFPNDTALGAPAYFAAAWTFYRFTAMNYSFQGISINGVVQNSSAYLMTPSEFDAFAATGNASAYVWRTGNVSQETVDLTFDSGTWYFMVTGWAVDEFRSVGQSWAFSFPDSFLYSS